MAQILKKFIGNDQVADEKIRLDNDSALRSRNAAGTADVNLIKANVANEAELGAILNAAGFELKNLGAPTAASSAVTKTFMDSSIATAVAGADMYARVASTANVAVATAPAAIDGITLVSGDRVLLNAQTAPAENGLYIFNGSAAALTRSTLMDAPAEFKTGLTLVVLEGTANGDTIWALQADVATVGTSAVTFQKVGAAAGGANLTLSNLTAPTAVNADIIPNGTFNLGSNASLASMWNNAHFKAAVKFFSAAGDTMHISGNTSSGAPAGGNSNPTLAGYRSDTNDKLSITTVSTSGTSFTQGISLETGNSAGSGNSGTVTLYAGTSGTGIRGTVRMDALAADLRARALTTMPLRFYSADNTTFVQMKSAATVPADVTLTLPPNAGAANQVLTTDGTGVLSWAAAAGTGANTALGNLTATAINQDLITDNQVARNIGSSGVPWSSLHLNSDLHLHSGTSDSFRISGAGFGTLPSGATAQARLFTTNFTGAGSNLALYTNANSGAASTANIRLETGNNTGATGPSGNVYLQTGTASAGRGSVVMDGLSADLAARGAAPMPLRFYDADNSNYVQMKSPAVVAANVSLTLPVDAGVSAQVLTTDGAGILSWSTPAVWNKEAKTIVAADVTAQYVDLAFPIRASSLDLVIGGLVQTEGVDYTVSLTGGVAGVTRVTFAGDLATAGATPVAAGDVLYFKYQK